MVNYSQIGHERGPFSLLGMSHPYGLRPVATGQAPINNRMGADSGNASAGSVLVGSDCARLLSVVILGVLNILKIWPSHEPIVFNFQLIHSELPRPFRVYGPGSRVTHVPDTLVTHVLCVCMEINRCDPMVAKDHVIPVLFRQAPR